MAQLLACNAAQDHSSEPPMDASSVSDSVSTGERGKLEEAGAVPQTDAVQVGPVADASSATLESQSRLDAGLQDAASESPKESKPLNESLEQHPDASLQDSSASLARRDANVSPVEFLHLRVTEIGATRAVVRFETSQEASCQVEYGWAPDALEHSATDPNMDPDNPYALEHQVPLEDLPSMTQIFFRAQVETRQGNVFTSDMDSFTTLAGAGDAGADWVNVALIAAGTQVTEVSSNYGGADNQGSWGINAALDGAMSTEWATHGDGDDAYVVLDFGAPRELAGFAYRSRKMSDGSSIVTSVKVGFDELTLGPFSTPDPDQRYEFIFESPVVTRSMRLDVVTSTGGNTGAKEIEALMRP